jgi:hypothetical protein
MMINESKVERKRGKKYEEWNYDRTEKKLRKRELGYCKQWDH